MDFYCTIILKYNTSKFFFEHFHSIQLHKKTFFYYIFICLFYSNNFYLWFFPLESFPTSSQGDTENANTLRRQERGSDGVRHSDESGCRRALFFEWSLVNHTLLFSIVNLPQNQFETDSNARKGFAAFENVLFPQSVKAFFYEAWTSTGASPDAYRTIKISRKYRKFT